MTREALERARQKTSELIDTYEGRVSERNLHKIVRAIQDEFKTWLATDPDCCHEVLQHWIRGCVLHRLNIGTPRDDDDSDEPDYVKARRESGFHHYVDRSET